MRIALAGSGGGHIRQLLDLQPVWSGYDAFFVTEPTALGRSLAAEHRTYFVDHFAVGQAKLGQPFRMLRSAWRNIWQSYRVIRTERPDVFITTGAGAVFSALLWARLFGAKTVAIESFARFERPSLFMRCAAPFAHRKVVQSSKLSGWWRGAEVFDPFRFEQSKRPPKNPLLFATVGATLPFDRLVNSIADLKASGEIPERVLVQVGEGGVRPPEVECVESLSFAEMQSILKEADIVVTHGGTGSLITALREHCRVVAMPRLSALGEHYDDHQEEITSAFADRGLVVCARTVEELRAALKQVREKEPVAATTDPQALLAWLRDLLSQWGGRPGKAAALQR